MPAGPKRSSAGIAAATGEHWPGNSCIRGALARRIAMASCSDAKISSDELGRSVCVVRAAVPEVPAPLRRRKVGPTLPVAAQASRSARAPSGGERTPRKNETSRWNAGKDLSFVPLRPEKVVEVRYDYMEGVRFRHTAQFVRWRPDRDPEYCTYDQLERPVRFNLADVLTTS